MEKKFVAFISYRHRPLDMAVATAIHRRIERYTVPKSVRKDRKRRMGRVFRDREELAVGGNLNEKIRSALDRSQYLIVVCTPATPESYWCNLEIDYFLSHHSRDRVLLVLADGTPEKSVPPQLLQLGGDAQLREEPMCADLVSHSRKLPVKILTALTRLGDEFLRLAAAMLECSYDDLKQRQKRRNRNILLGASAAALIIIGTLTSQNITIRQQNEEISAQKLQLEQQLQQTLLNESEALALISTGQLEEGDRRGALESAVRALPYEGNERPYVAAAEYALTGALYAYQKNTVRFDTLTEQETDIIAVDVSAGSRQAVTLDIEGCVRCFDMDSQSKLWSYHLRNWNMDPAAASIYVNSIHVLENRQAVLCIDQWAVTLLSLEDGSVLWKHEDIGAGYGTVTEVSPDENWLAIGTENRFQLFNLETEESRGFSFSKLAESGGKDLTPVGCSFSSDGMSAVCLFSRAEDENDIPDAVIAYVDLELLDGFYVPYWICGDGAAVTALENRQFLISFTRKNKYYVLCTTDRGETVYEQTLTVSLPDSHYPSAHPAAAYEEPTSEVVSVSSAAGAVCWAYDNAIVTLDSNTGDLIQMIPLGSRCLWAGLDEDGRLTYILADGTFRSRMLGQEEEEILMDCGFPLAIGTGESSAYMVVPEHSASRCLRLVYNPGTWGVPLDLTDLPGQYRVYRDPAGDQILISVTQIGRNGRSNSTSVLFDSRDMSRTGEITMTYNGFDSFCADGKSLLQSSSVYDIATGESREIGYSSDAVDYVSVRKTVSPSDQREGKPVLTAGLSGTLLCWWQDGDNPKQTEVPCPEMTVIWPDPYWDNLEVGQNGLVAMQLSDHPDAELAYIPCPTTKFAVFDTDREVWSLLDNPTPNATAPARICMGVEKKQMAIVDENGMLYLYDQAAESVILEADIHIAAGAIDQMNFVQQDRLLLVTQINGTVTAVDTASGAGIASWKISGYDRDQELVISTDESRLYICETGGYGSGMCIDLASMTVIADIPGLACYLPATGEIVRIDPSAGTVSVGPMYTLEELIRLAQTP